MVGQLRVAPTVKGWIREEAKRRRVGEITIISEFVARGFESALNEWSGDIARWLREDDATKARPRFEVME